MFSFATTLQSSKYDNSHKITRKEEKKSLKKVAKHVSTYEYR